MKKEEERKKTQVRFAVGTTLAAGGLAHSLVNRKKYKKTATDSVEKAKAALKSMRATRKESQEKMKGAFSKLAADYNGKDKTKLSLRDKKDLLKLGKSKNHDIVRKKRMYQELRKQKRDNFKKVKGKAKFDLVLHEINKRNVRINSFGTAAGAAALYLNRKKGKKDESERKK